MNFPSFRDSKIVYSILFFCMQASLPLGRWRGIVSALLLIISHPAGAQNEPVRFGVIESRDLTAAPFVGDSAASAVVLCDFGRSRLKGQGGGFQVVFERVTRIKILKKPGYEYATVEIPLYHRDDNQEKVSNLRGFTYNLVGNAVEKIRLETSGAFLEKRTPTVSVQKFTLPNVRVGSVVEFAYILTSDFLFNFQDWTFQRDIPVRWSEYRVSIPSFYHYKILYQSAQAFAVNKATVGSTNLVLDNKIPSGGGLSSGQTTGSLTISAPTEEHTWALRDVAAFGEEPFMTTAGDYMARLDFELTGEQWPDAPYHDLTGTWEKINAALLADEDFGGRLGHIGFMQDQLQGLAANYPAITERAAAVRQLVMAAATPRHENRTLNKPALSHADNVNQPLVLDYEFTQPAEGTTAASPIYLSPLSEFGLGQNPFRREERDFPVDFGLAQDDILVVNLTLPAGYELAAVPKPAVVELPDGGGRFMYSVATAAPGAVTLTSHLTLRNAVYSAAQYPTARVVSPDAGEARREAHHSKKNRRLAAGPFAAIEAV